VIVEFQSSDSAKYIPRADEIRTVWEVASKADPKTFVAFDASESHDAAVAAGVDRFPSHVLYFAGGGGPLHIYLDVPEFTVSFVHELGALERGAAIKLVEAKQQVAIRRSEDALAKTEDSSVAELTMGSYKTVMQQVRDVKGQRVLVLYYGSFVSCNEERETLEEAAKTLNANGAKNIILSQINCDIHTLIRTRVCQCWPELLVIADTTYL
jgi:hypothetical protein